MLSATDSFIQYLSDGLSGNPPVAFVRVSPDPQTCELQVDCLNVSVLAFNEHGQLERPLVSLDIITSDERIAYKWAQRTRDFLLERQYVQERSYDPNPNSPTDLGRCVFWSVSDISFDKVRQSTRSVHLNATFHLSHVRH